MLSFLDKQTWVDWSDLCVDADPARLNYSNAYGLQEDTHMKGNDYSWVASALYFGWLIGAYPWNIILQRYPIGKILGSMLFVWGTVCMLQAAVFNFAGFFAIRFFLGMLEACISPAFVILTSMLWTREEQALRTSFWLSTNGVSSILGALLAYGSGHADNLAVPNWKLIYLVGDSPTYIGHKLTCTDRWRNDIRLGFRHPTIFTRWSSQRQDAFRVRTNGRCLESLEESDGYQASRHHPISHQRGSYRPQDTLTSTYGGLYRHPERWRRQLYLFAHQRFRLQRSEDESSANTRRRF